MPSQIGPKIENTGLVFALDAADRKNCMLPFSIFLNTSTWTVGYGSVGSYGQNGQTIENQRLVGTDPWGNSTIVWQSNPEGGVNDDGGWNNGWYDIDRTKLYRWSVWVKRTSSSGAGTSYFGLYGSGGTWGVERLDGGGNEGNPYWECQGTSAYTQNKWYLLVGHCYPTGTPIGSIPGNKHPDTGRYSVQAGGKDGDLNYCNIGGDVRWLSNSTVGLHRTYHYYCPDPSTHLQWYDPRFEICDGTEPTISDLLREPATYAQDLIGTYNTPLTNGTTITKNAIGSFFFDGTDDFINTTGTPPELQGNPDLTVIGVFKRTGDFDWSGCWGIGGEASMSGLCNWNYSSTNQITIDLWGNSTFTCGQTYPLNQWVFVVWQKEAGPMTVDNCTIWKNLTKYTGGQLTVLRSPSGNPTINNYGITLGSISQTTGYCAPFEIANFRVWDRILNESEIIDIYNQVKTRFNLP